MPYSRTKAALGKAGLPSSRISWLMGRAGRLHKSGRSRGITLMLDAVALGLAVGEVSGQRGVEQLLAVALVVEFSEDFEGRVQGGGDGGFFGPEYGSWST